VEISVKPKVFFAVHQFHSLSGLSLTMYFQTTHTNSTVCMFFDPLERIKDLRRDERNKIEIVEIKKFFSKWSFNVV